MKPPASYLKCVRGAIQSILLARLSRAQADPLCAVFQSARWIRYTLKNIVPLDYLGVFKSCIAHCAEKVCIQQTAGNSTGP